MDQETRELLIDCHKVLDDRTRQKNTSFELTPIEFSSLMVLLDIIRDNVIKGV
jgi:hypothetical protein